MQSVIDVLESGERSTVANELKAAMNAVLPELEQELESSGYTRVERRGREIGYSALQERAVGVQTFDTDQGPVEAVYSIEKDGFKKDLRQVNPV